MIQSMSVENEQAGLPKLPHETIFSAANRVIFPVQLTTSRIGNLAYPVDPYSIVQQHLPILYRHGQSVGMETCARPWASFAPVFCIYIYIYFFSNLTYSRWTSSLPSCLWSLRIFPSLPGSRLTIFYRDASSALLQLVNQWLNFTYTYNIA